MPDKKQKIIVILGPNASGKSALAVRLAKKFGGEIVSADSRQVYTGLDIGTGKITKREMDGVRHHLLGVTSPKKTFTVADFKKQAAQAIKEISKRGNIPFIVGGTGFYIEMLADDIEIPSVPPNTTLRARLERKTAEALFKELRKKDPARAETIDPRNKCRLIRSLEIVHTIGAVPKKKKNAPYDVLQIGIQTDDARLQKKIRVRLYARMKQGMIAEAKRLHACGLSWKRMEALGLEYRYLARYLRGAITKEEMLEQLERENWRYAKRQKTWFRRDKRINWFHKDEAKKIEKEIHTFLDRK